MAKWQIFKRDLTPAGEVETVAVIGMGRFGLSLTHELMSIGADVLAVDINEDIIQALNGKVTKPVIADATKEDVLTQLEIPDMDCVVVAIGNSVEASILVTSTLLGLGVKDVWVKAVSDAHERILRQLGVKHVVHPENEMGRRVAHLIHGHLQDWISLGDGLALVRTTPPPTVTGITIRDAHIRSRYGVTVISVKHAGGVWSDVTGDTILETTD